MKKYKFGLFALLFALGLFVFNTNPVEALVSGCSSTVGYSATTGEFCGGTTTPPDYQSPIISGVSGPQYLDVNGTGTWTVKAYDKNGGDLSYAVVWGDEIYASLLLDSNSGKRPITQQSATFTHSYSQAGNYTPRFTVTNNRGQSAYVSLDVRVGNMATLQPSITLTAFGGGISGQNITVNKGGSFYVSGIPHNLGVGYSRAFFFNQSFGNTNSCSSNSAEDTTWTMTCGPANTIGSSYFYVEIYQNGKTYKSNIVTVNVSDSGTSSIAVLSPNGGETWVKGTTQKIKWDDVSNVKYDIKFTSYYTPCTSNICPMVYHMPYIIASDVYGNSSDGHSYFYWLVGSGPGFDTVPDGSYTIQVCQSGTDNCDSSDSYFKIVKGLPIIIPPTPICSSSGYDTTTGFRCGCTSTKGYSSYDGNSCAPTTTPPTPVCSNGVNTVTGFVCGCTSRNGWSSTDGHSCTGCDSTSGYNILTGASCAPTTTPPIFECKNGYDVNTGFRCGCTSTKGYSSYDGNSCSLGTFPPGCNSANGYSTTTGELCSGKAIPIPMPNPTPIATCTITTTLRLGSTGADVSCLQSRIGLISDGKFGPRTLIAVKAFQANAGLRADGVVGPKSISALEVAN